MRWMCTGSYPILVVLATSLTYMTCLAAAINRETNVEPFSEVETEASEATLIRRRRAVVAPKANATFTLRRTYPVQNITHMTFGQKISFELVIEFPNRLTDMSVELFAPDNETEVMMLCNWNITHVGGKTNVNSSDVLKNAIAEGRNGSAWPFTRVVLNLGNITLADASGTSADDYAVKITFDTIMIKTSVTVTNGSKHWVSAGAEYNNDDEIWVGQAAFIAVTDDDTTSYTPGVDFVGPNEVEAGRTNPYKLDMYLPYKSLAPLTVDILAPLNNTDVISMCAAFVSSSGDSYKCLNPSLTYATTKMFPYIQNFYKTTLNFGNIANAGSDNPSRPNASDHIVVSFYLRVNDSATVSTSTYIGAGVQLGTRKIWAGAKTISVKASTALVNLTSPVTITHTQNATGTIPPYKITFSDIKIVVPSNKTTDIIFKATSDDATIPRFHVCKMEVTRAGRNYPCVKELVGTNAMPIIYEATRSESPWVISKVTATMKAVINTGEFSDSADNELVFRVYYSPTNNTNNVNGNNAKMTFNVEWGGGQTNADATINFADPLNVTSIANTSVPTFNFSLAGGASSDVKKGEGRNLKLNVTVSRGQLYTPVSIELVLPYDTFAYYTVCKAEVEWVGRGLPCLQLGEVNKNIKYTSKSTTDPSKKDRAVVTFGGLCSFDDNSLTDDDYMFGLKFAIYHQTEGSIVNDKENWISAGMMISTSQLWVGQVKLKTKTAAISDSSTPDVYIKRKDSTGTTMYQNDVAMYYVIIKVRPDSQPLLTAEFYFNGTENGKMSMCNVQVASRGDCIACTDDTVIYTNYSSAQQYNEKATINLGNVKNINCTTGGGFYQHEYQDENSLVLLLVVKSSEAATGSRGIVGKITYNTASSKYVATSVTVTASKPPTGTESKPTYKSQLAPLIDGMNLSSSYLGQAFRMYIDVILQPGSKHYLDITVGNNMSANIFDITNFNVHSAGSNIPCIKPGVPDAQYSRRANSKHQDFAKLNIGTCANTRIYPDTEENNRIRLEVIGRVWMKLDATGGSTELYTLTFLNQDFAQVTESNITYAGSGNITDYVNDTSQNLTGTVNGTNLAYRPGEVVKVPLIITVPRLAVFNQVLVDFRSPDVSGTDSAVMTVKNITFTRSGENLAFFTNEPYPWSQTSSRNTSQMDKGLVNLGIFQNTGVSHRLNRHEADAPDSFTVEYELQLADNEQTSNGSTFWMSFGVSTGSQILLVNKSFTVMRDGTESAHLNLTATVENNTKVFKAGEDIRLTVNISHRDTSAQEPRDVYVNILFPAFLEFVSTGGYEFIGNFTPSAIANGRRYAIPHIFFTDKVNITLTLRMKANLELPGARLQAYGSPVIEAVFKVFNRTSNPNNGKWLRNATAAQCRVQGKVPASAASCQSDLGLGNTAVIQDCQISAFMSPYASHPPKEIRSTSSLGWKPHTRGGYYAEKRYITVQFGKNTYVTKVVLHRISGVSKVTKVGIYKTMDGRAFVKVDVRTITWSGDTATISLTKKMLCRGMRIAVLESENNSNDEVAFKMDLFGCAHNDTSQKYNPCGIKEFDALPDPPNPDYQMRSYLHTGSAIFYCDRVPRKDTTFDIQSRCFHATDSTPNTWRDLGPMVGSVIGYHHTGLVFGLGPNTQSYVMSEDSGLTWKAVNKGKWEITKGKGGIKEATAIPWNTTTVFKAGVTGTACTGYTENDWHFCYDGIYKSTTKVLDWNSCCL